MEKEIRKTIQLLSDRQKVVQALKEIIFTKQFNAYEVKHVQAIVEQHYWLFGEQYNLVAAAEPDFEQALIGLILKTTGKKKKVKIDHPDKNAEMDIYMLRQDRLGKVVENVVVELKRPSVRLGEEEISGVKKYMRVIKSDSRFNAGNVKWTFYLIGNRFDDSSYIEGELEAHQNLGENHLIHCQDNGLTKIYVLRWSEVFNDFSMRYDFLMNRLKIHENLWFERHNSADDAVDSLSSNSAALPSALIPKSKKILSNSQG